MITSSYYLPNNITYLDCTKLLRKMFTWVDQRFERHLIEDWNFDSVKLIKLGFKGTVEKNMAEQQARLRSYF